MGRWGMGLSSSDEYMDVKDEFFDFFYKGIPTKKIEDTIIRDYSKEFKKNDGEWYDVYFALADCEWKCGNVSDWLVKKIKNIITNRKAISYFRELSATDKDIKIYAKNLEKFLAKITIKNPKPIVQKIKKPYTPPLKAGDVFVWKIADSFRAAVCLYAYITNDGTNKYCFTYLITISASKWVNLPSLKEIENSYSHSAAWYLAFEILAKKEIVLIGNIKDKLKDNYENCYGLDIEYIAISNTQTVRHVSYGNLGNKNDFSREIKTNTNDKLVKDMF
jgi:hypothetical protein